MGQVENRLKRVGRLINEHSPGASYSMVTAKMHFSGTERETRQNGPVRGGIQSRAPNLHSYKRACTLITVEQFGGRLSILIFNISFAEVPSSRAARRSMWLLRAGYVAALFVLFSTKSAHRDEASVTRITYMPSVLRNSS